MNWSRHGRLVITPHGTREWELAEALVVDAGGDRVEVPCGFLTDLASVPRLFWAIFPPFGSYTEAAVLHDWLYYSHETNRRTADRLFLQVMIEDGTAVWRAGLMWLVVRGFGWWNWRYVSPKRKRFRRINGSKCRIGGEE